MKNENYYVISDTTYHGHIDNEVHLYGLLHQLAFMAGKVKDAKDMEHFQETAIRYGEIADEIFAGLTIPGRYLVYGDKADLADLRTRELEPLDGYEPEDEDSEDECVCPRCALAGIVSLLDDLSDSLAEVLAELDGE